MSYRLIDVNERHNHRCYFCDTKTSVKYLTEVYDGIPNAKPRLEYTCNMCALKYASKVVPHMEVYRSVHGTVRVMVQNCSSEVITLLHRFDIWKSNGEFRYDEKCTKLRPEIWFECPKEFLTMLQSEGRMLRSAFERMGVKEINVY